VLKKRVALFYVKEMFVLLALMIYNNVPLLMYFQIAAYLSFC